MRKEKLFSLLSGPLVPHLLVQLHQARLIKHRKVLESIHTPFCLNNVSKGTGVPNSGLQQQDPDWEPNLNSLSGQPESPEKLLVCTRMNTLQGRATFTHNQRPGLIHIGLSSRTAAHSLIPGPYEALTHIHKTEKVTCETAIDLVELIAIAGRAGSFSGPRRRNAERR